MSSRWWIRHLVYKDLYERYLKQEEPKPKRTTFSSRVIRYWIDKEQALTTENLLSYGKRKKFWSIIREDWRVCSVCKEFKKREEFSKDKQNKSWYTSNCKECRNKYKLKWRKETGYIKDRRYKENKRNLKVWEQIYFQDDIREVISYKYKKWYTVKSILNWYERIIDTNDNHYTKGNHCVRYTKLKTLLKVKTIEQIQKEKELKEQMIKDLFD